MVWLVPGGWLVVVLSWPWRVWVLGVGCCVFVNDETRGEKRWKEEIFNLIFMS